MNTSITIVLYTSKVKKNGESPVMIRFIKDRKVKYLSTGLNFKKEDWDVKGQAPKKKHPLYLHAKALLAKKEEEATKILLNHEIEDKELSVDQLTEKVKGKRAIKATILKYFDEVIEREIKSGKIGNSRAYKDTRNSFQSFLNKKDIKFNELSLSLLKSYEEVLLGNKLSKSTISLYLRTLRAIYNRAIKEGKAKQEHYPFRDFNFSDYNKIKTAKRAINKEDILKIKDLLLDESLNIHHSRNYFMFSYYLRGINFIDLALLKWNQIRNGRLEYFRSKTGGYFNIEILEPAMKILNYYKKLNYGGVDSYVFPILKFDQTDPMKISNRIKNGLKQVNKDLKKIGEKASINTQLTFYVGRHTFATVLKKSGVSTAIISESMGHESEEITNTYLVDFENKVLDDASKALL